MHRVIFHKRAAKALRRIPKERANQILAAIDDLSGLPDPATHQNVLAMRGQFDGAFQMRVGEYHVIFSTSVDGQETRLIILIADVGSRGDIY